MCALGNFPASLNTASKTLPNHCTIISKHFPNHITGHNKIKQEENR